MNLHLWPRSPKGRCWLRPGPLLLAATLLAGCNRTPALSDLEKEALARLDDYEPTATLDEKSRVCRLKLDGPHVDDDALAEVGQFKMLRWLSLSDAAVTDAGIEKLRDLKRLQSLGIAGTRVTDRGLSALQGNASLRWLWVTETDKLTPAGIQALKKALPAVTVYVLNRAGSKGADETTKTTGAAKPKQTSSVERISFREGGRS